MTDSNARAWQRGFDAGWDAHQDPTPYRANPYAADELARLIHANSYPWCRQPDVRCQCGVLAERLVKAGVKP